MNVIYPKSKPAVISIVIPTYNRAEDLGETLGTIFCQTYAPQEIIIVDDSDNNDTELLIASLKERQNKLLIYIRNKGEMGISAARNLGMKAARGDIILFLDDDIILDRNYLLEMAEIFESFPEAKGIQGWMQRDSPKGFDAILPAIKKAFYLTHTVENECRALSSTNVTYPHDLCDTITCEWLHGCNFSLRTSVLSELKFDEKLKGYSWKEDLDLSYRIHLKYPGSLYISPKARLIHKESSSGRRQPAKVIFIKEAYEVYIFFKDFDKGIGDRIIFIWSKFGAMILLLREIRRRSIREVITELSFQLKAQLLCIKNLRDIKRGNFDVIFENNDK